MFFRHITRAVLLLIAVAAAAQDPPAGVPLDPAQQQIRDRYEQVLARNPYQEQAFDRVYDAWLVSEGVDAWLKRLESGDNGMPYEARLILRGRILARQLRTGEAITAFLEARAEGASDPALDKMLGQLYYDAGRDAEAIEVLSAALESVEQPEERARLSRLLGNVYLRSGNQDEAIATWERLADAAPGDHFALQELAELFEANRLWDRAAATWERLADAAKDDPYRQCSALRSLGRARAAIPDYPGAIAAFEAGLALAAPGNWLHADLKDRLVSVYEAQGDLAGLVAYLEARVEANPQDLEFQELLAQIHLRREEPDAAEATARAVIDRAPTRQSAWELLLRIYEQAGRLDEMAAAYETLIDRFPNDPDFLRRLGEAWLRHNQPEKALEAWARTAAGDAATAEDHARHAEWLERREFYPEAAAAYARALALRADREWRLRVASIQYAQGEEDAARAAWEAAVAAGDTPAEALAEVAGILASHDLAEDALKLYDRAMNQDPDNLDYVLSSARLRVASGDVEGAIPLFERLAEAEDQAFFQDRGEQGLLDAYAALETLDERREAWEREVAASPEAVAPRMRLARLYSRMGNRPRAAALYAECAKLDPGNIEIKRRLAEALRMNRKTAEAAAVLEGLMVADPARANGYLRELLGLYATAGDRDAAIRAAEQLVERAPGSAEARAELAATYLRYGEAEKALQQFRNLIQIDGDEPAYYRDFGDALLRTNQFGEAADAFRKMLETSQDAQRPDAVSRLASVYVRMGQADIIVREFQDRLRNAPRDLGAYQELAAAYRAAGDRPAAFAALESARGVVEDEAALLRLLLAEAYDNGDYRKVVEAHTALIALSGQPSVFELDRLAQAHARTGDLEAAVSVWESIAEENAEDSAAQVMVARSLFENGYLERARDFIQRALAIDPYDYNLRYQHAVELLNNNLPDEAVAELKRILEIGERPEPEGGQGSAQPAPGSPAPSPLAPAFVSPHMPYGGFGGGRLGGFSQGGFGGWNTSSSAFRPMPVARMGGRNVSGFDAMRSQVLQLLVQIARQTGEQDTLLAEYAERAEANPDNIDARFDYLAVCELAGDNKQALAVARGLAEIYPEDTDLRWRLVHLTESVEDIDGAIALAQSLAASEDAGAARRAMFHLLGLYFAREDTEEAAELVDRLVSFAPEDPHLHLELGYHLSRFNRHDEAEAQFEKAAALNPALRRQINNQLAQTSRMRGEIGRARELYTDLLFAEADPAAPTMAQRPARMHMPRIDGRPWISSGNLGQMFGVNFVPQDHGRLQAFQFLVQMDTDGDKLEPIIDRLREEARAYTAANTPEAQARAAGFVAFYIASQFNSAGPEAALAEVDSLLEARPGDFLLINFRALFLDVLGRHNEMAPLYDALEKDPALRPADIAQARLHLALARNNHDEAVSHYRNWMALGGNTAYLSRVVRALEQGGAPDKARLLLEEDLARARRPETLALLSQAHTRAGEHKQAITLAREAWQLQSAGAGRLGPRHPSFGYQHQNLNLGSLGLQALHPLWDASEKAGQMPALIASFEEQLAGQPNAVTLHMALVGIHAQNKRPDLALKQAGELLARRPNDAQIALLHASLLEANGEKEAALAKLEDLARANPGNRRAFSNELQRLYQELNKTEDLEALRDRLMEEARDPAQMHELAQRFARDQEWGKAAEMLERVQRIHPENQMLFAQIADYYWRGGQRDKSIAVWRDFLEKDEHNLDAGVHGAPFATAVSRFAQAGALADLKARVEAGRAADPDARRWALMAAMIAQHEKRYADARTDLEKLLGGQDEPGIRRLLSDLAEKQGKWDEALAFVDQPDPARGGRDYQRLAALYLKKGDPDGAVAQYKLQAEHQASPHVHIQAIESLIRAGYHSPAERYFLDIAPRMPRSDWTYRNLGEIIIEEHVKRENIATSTIDLLFDQASQYGGQFAEKLTQDYRDFPPLALERLAPIAARHPENPGIQLRMVDIYEQLGDYGRAVEIMERLPEESREIQRYQRLLEVAGRPEERKAALASWLNRNESPHHSYARYAAEAYRNTGDFEGLRALRDAVLEKAPASARPMLASAFDSEVPGRDPGAALRDAWEANRDAQGLRRYMDYLEQRGDWEAAARAFREYRGAGGAEGLAFNDASRIARVLIAAGDHEAAWQLAWETARREENNYDFSSHFRMAFEKAREHAAPAEAARALVEAARAQSVLTLNERVFLAGLEAHLGHMASALEWLDVEVKDFRVAQGRDAVLNELPPPLREALNPKRPEDPSENTREAVQQAINEARQAAARGGAPVEMLDQIEFNDENAGYRLQRAVLYRREKAWEKAIADCRAVLEAEPANTEAAMVLAASLAGVGSYAEAMDLWRTFGPRHGGREGIALAQLLMENGQFDAAREVLETPATFRTRDTEADMLYAEVLFKSGAAAEIPAAMEARHAVRSGESREQFERDYGRFLAEGARWRDFAAQAASGEFPSLSGALLVVSKQLRAADGNGDARAEVAALLEPVVWARASQVAEYSDLFHSLGNLRAAAAALVAGFPAARYDSRGLGDLIYRLTQSGAAGEAAKALLDASERYPELLSHPYRALDLIAKLPESETTLALLDRLQALSYPDAQRDYNLAWIARARGEQEDALARYRALLDSPDFQENWVDEFAGLFLDAGLPEDAGAVYDRARNNPAFRSDVRDHAAEVRITLHLKQGAVTEAIQVFAEMLPARQERVANARDAILANAVPERWDAADTLLRSLIEADPAHHRVSDLIALRSRFARLAGATPEPIDPDALGAPAHEAHEIALWTGLVDAWRLSDPAALPDWETMAAPLDAPLAAWLRGESDGAALAGWREVGPRAICPVLSPGRLFVDGRGHLSNHAAYAAAEVESPDERAVTFAHGSSGWTRIWVNGQEVHQNPVSRICLIDQDRIEVPLRAGVNRILVKTAVRHGDWEFALSILRGAEGLTIRAPEVPQTEPQNPESTPPETPIAKAVDP
ncbi:MAG: tetratricopeptide repeat protein [Candidatus Hydrogenedentes bacterium]|nr:tetratricopeptide repeat protein [Candidatus Hydrogenedentota bacterium]